MIKPKIPTIHIPNKNHIIRIIPASIINAPASLLPHLKNKPIRGETV